MPRLSVNRLFARALAALLLLAVIPSAYATTATLNLRTGGTSGNAGGAGYYCSQTKVVDFASKTSLKQDSWSTVTAGSVVQLFNIPGGSFVTNCSVEVLTAQGATCTAKIGDAADDDGLFTACDFNAAASTTAVSFNATTTPAYGAGKLFTAPAVIALKLNHDTTKAKVRVRIFYQHLKE
jgi:hypothetical protein